MDPKKLTAQEVLQDARSLLVQGWIKARFAQTAEGKDAGPNDPAAAKFCASGAVRRVAGGVDARALWTPEFYALPKEQQQIIVDERFKRQEINDASHAEALMRLNLVAWSRNKIRSIDIKDDKGNVIETHSHRAESIVDFNDTDSTTLDEVLSVFDEAAVMTAAQVEALKVEKQAYFDALVEAARQKAKKPAEPETPKAE